MAKLTFYFSHGCGFCRKVLQYMENNNIVIPMKDVNETSDHRKELVAIGGKSQVPCLIIDGEALYESDDIIEWLHNNWEDPNQ